MRRDVYYDLHVPGEEHYLADGVWSHNTGKTTIVARLPEMLGLTAGDPDGGLLYGAYSGKAAHVLRTKGCTGAATLHRLSQVAVPNPAKIERDAIMEELEADRLAQEAITRGDAPHAPEGMLTAQGRAHLERRAKELEKPARKLTFARGEDSPIRSASLLVCDEVSMVDERIGKDLESFGTKILVVGDPAQLPPIRGGGYWTAPGVRLPTVHLSQVLRQALDSDVLRHATWVREVAPHHVRMAMNALARHAPATLDDLLGVDQVLTAFNDSRWKVITAIRDHLGRPSGEPVPGDRVICLRNNTELGVFNGQTFEVLEAGYDRRLDLFPLVVRDDLGEEWDLPTYGEGYTASGEDGAQGKGLGWRDDIALCTFAQAMTVHKAQGSEWPDIAVIAEPFRQRWDVQPWLYTALTRARDSAATYPEVRTR